ncbi:MAG: hypothetical protein LBL09_02915 [Oscillospiraceae bacterium]|jgi:hypothetical protein|nr:hypothetical protein [Oscillospiraceae bacterium]
MYKKLENRFSQLHAAAKAIIKYGMLITAIYLTGAVFMLLLTYTADFQEQLTLHSYVKDFISIGAVVLIETCLGSYIINSRLQ